VTRTIETSGMHRQVEVKVMLSRNGQQSECYLLLSTAVSNLPEGRRIVVCLEDITARKRAELDLVQALRAVQQLGNELQQENLCLRQEIKHARGFDEIVGACETFQCVLDQVAHVAPTSAAVLILGETGTGKELIARAIHERSLRKDRPLVTIDCGSLPGGLMESELFGHVAGAYTGALTNTTGRFELAHRGTIFLDEIAELSLEMQAKLLRVLQDGQFWVLGGSTKTVDVRVIAATNRDLGQATAAGTFRSDLYYRLAVFPIEVPPLRTRRRDIPLLVWHFLRKHRAALGKKFESIGEAALAALSASDWPGNVRELENVIVRAMILSPGPLLHVEQLLIPPGGHRPRAASGQDLASVDRAHVTHVLEHCGWKIKGPGNAAERLGMKPSTLRSRLQKLGIARPRP
jgi:transcriptional regulator with GAF, ATPase, and Fis domain